MNRRAAWGIALVMLTGCGRSPEPALSEGSARVICGTPAVAEIVFALGCGDQVAGVSAFTDWPPEAAAKPVIGGALSPNRERILQLQPSLILSQGKAEILGDWAHAQGIPFVTVPLDTLEELRAAINVFASALGVGERGSALWEELMQRVEPPSFEEPVSVCVAIGHAPGDLSGLMTTGPGTFLDELISRAGGHNIFADVKVDWPRISQESLIRRAPAVLLDFQPFPVEAKQVAALASDWKKLGFRADQVRLLDEAVFLRPGPRALRSVSLLIEAIRGSEKNDSPE